MNEAKQQRLNGTGERGNDDDWRKEKKEKMKPNQPKGGREAWH
jgi:hypothetical protein